MLTEICAILHNYFSGDDDKHFGEFIISGGSIAPLDFLADGQYYRIIGSKFNDGVHLYPTTELTDETFDGAIWAMNVPPAVLKIAEEIKDFNTKTQTGNFTSETLSGAYSYTKATDAHGRPLSWQDLFSPRLTPWRKL